MSADTAFGTLVLVALPAAVLYPLIYGFRTRWWRTWIGRALLIKACGLADLLLVSAAFQVFGPNYPGRDFFRIFGMALVALGVWLALFAMIRALTAPRDA